jgi:hypothetical protein
MLAAVGLFCFSIPVACLGDELEVEELTILPCAPGELRGCRCDSGGRGIQECVGNGSRFGECVNCGASCTVFPNCGGCLDCFETCVCQSRGDVEGCQETCVGQVSAGQVGGGSCTVETCPEPNLPVAQKCCTDQNQCGLSVELIGGGCIAGGQPGAQDSECPPVDLAAFGLPLTLNGCCRPNGMCGVLDTFIGFGCADPAAFGQAFEPVSCTP